MAKTAAHPKYIDMVVSAIKALAEKNGSSRQAINKYIVKEYKLTENNHHLAMLKQALIRGSSDKAKGPLAHNKGKGAAGSFKLNTALTAAKPKSKPKSPKKKAAKAKKKVVKKAAKKAPKAKAKAPAPAVPESAAVAEQKPAKSAKVAKAKVAVKKKSASKAASPKKPKAKKSPKKGPTKKSKK